MANYIARVELKVAVPEDYERLNLSMQQRGYARKITGEDGVIYQLPTGVKIVGRKPDKTTQFRPKEATFR
jgi:hypothetical protein